MQSEATAVRPPPEVWLPVVNDFINILPLPPQTVGRKGICRFVGSTEFADGVWVGVELVGSVGRNNGAVQSVQYFQCLPGQGLFVRPEVIEPFGGSGKAVGGMSSKEGESSSAGEPKKNIRYEHELRADIEACREQIVERDNLLSVKNNQIEDLRLELQLTQEEKFNAEDLLDESTQTLKLLQLYAGDDRKPLDAAAKLFVGKLAEKTSHIILGSKSLVTRLQQESTEMSAKCCALETQLKTFLDANGSPSTAGPQDTSKNAAHISALENEISTLKVAQKKLQGEITSWQEVSEVLEDELLQHRVEAEELLDELEKLSQAHYNIVASKDELIRKMRKKLEEFDQQTIGLFGEVKKGEEVMQFMKASHSTERSEFELSLKLLSQFVIGGPSKKKQAAPGGACSSLVPLQFLSQTSQFMNEFLEHFPSSFSSRTSSVTQQQHKQLFLAAKVMWCIDQLQRRVCGPLNQHCVALLEAITAPRVVKDALHRDQSVGSSSLPIFQTDNVLLVDLLLTCLIGNAEASAIANSMSVAYLQQDWLTANGLISNCAKECASLKPNNERFALNCRMLLEAGPNEIPTVDLSSFPWYLPQENNSFWNLNSGVGTTEPPSESLIAALIQGVEAVPRAAHWITQPNNFVSGDLSPASSVARYIQHIPSNDALQLPKRVNLLRDRWTSVLKQQSQGAEKKDASSTNGLQPQQPTTTAVKLEKSWKVFGVSPSTLHILAQLVQVLETDIEKLVRYVQIVSESSVMNEDEDDDTIAKTKKEKDAGEGDESLKASQSFSRTNPLFDGSLSGTTDEIRRTLQEWRTEVSHLIQRLSGILQQQQPPVSIAEAVGEVFGLILLSSITFKQISALFQAQFRDVQMKFATSFWSSEVRSHLLRILLFPIQNAESFLTEVFTSFRQQQQTQGGDDARLPSSAFLATSFLCGAESTSELGGLLRSMLSPFLRQRIGSDDKDRKDADVPNEQMKEIARLYHAANHFTVGQLTNSVAAALLRGLHQGRASLRFPLLHANRGKLVRLITQLENVLTKEEKKGSETEDVRSDEFLPTSNSEQYNGEDDWLISFTSFQGDVLGRIFRCVVHMDYLRFQANPEREKRTVIDSEANDQHLALIEAQKREMSSLKKELFQAHALVEDLRHFKLKFEENIDKKEATSKEHEQVLREMHNTFEEVLATHHAVNAKLESERNKALEQARNVTLLPLSRIERDQLLSTAAFYRDRYVLLLNQTESNYRLVRRYTAAPISSATCPRAPLPVVQRFTSEREGDTARRGILKQKNWEEMT